MAGCKQPTVRLIASSALTPDEITILPVVIYGFDLKGVVIGAVGLRDAGRESNNSTPIIPRSR